MLIENGIVWYIRFAGAHKPAYLRSSVTELMNEFKTYLSEDPNEEQIESWLDFRVALHEVLLGQVRAVEEFVQNTKSTKQGVASESKNNRKEFYREKAEALDPPIPYDVLQKCNSYNNAIVIARPVADLNRSWRTLLPKIMAEVESARMQVEKIKEFQRQADFREELRKDYETNHIRRMGNDTLEQCFILDLAESVISNITRTKAWTSDATNADLVLLILQEFYTAYELADPKPSAFSGNGTHRLILDDVKMIYRLKILPRLDWRQPDFHIFTEKQLICNLCSSHRDPKCFPVLEFEKLLHHLFTDHSLFPWGFPRTNQLSIPSQIPYDRIAGLFGVTLPASPAESNTMADDFLCHTLLWLGTFPVSASHPRSFYDDHQTSMTLEAPWSETVELGDY